jgi:hypothetical protein
LSATLPRAAETFVKNFNEPIVREAAFAREQARRLNQEANPPVLLVILPCQRLTPHVGTSCWFIVCSITVRHLPHKILHAGHYSITSKISVPMP